MKTGFHVEMVASDVWIDAAMSAMVGVFELVFLLGKIADLEEDSGMEMESCHLAQIPSEIVTSSEKRISTVGSMHF